MSNKTIPAALKKVPAARVNKVIISAYMVETGLKLVLEPYKDAKGKVRLSQPEQYAARKQVIDNLILRELLHQEAVRQGLNATVKEIEQAVELSAKEYESLQQFKAMLIMSGSSYDEYRQQMKKDMIVNKLAAALVEGKKKSITTMIARQYYEDNIGEMKGQAARRILHIMLPLDAYASPETEQKVRDSLQKITSVKKFEKIVDKSSDVNPDFMAEDFGFVRRDQIDPMLETIAFSLEQGKISRVVKTFDGLHLLLVKSIIKEGEVIPFDLIKEEIKKKLYEKFSVEILNKFVDKLRKKAHIEIIDKIADSKLGQE